MPAEPEEAKAEDPADKIEDPPAEKTEEPQAKEDGKPDEIAADETAAEPKEDIKERIAKDPLELEILETSLPEKIEIKTLPQITRGDWEVEWRKLKQYFD